MFKRCYLVIGTILVSVVLGISDRVIGETESAIEVSEAKQIPDPTPTIGMTESLDVDLRNDPRKDFQTRGAVEWESGRLTIGPDGEIRRPLDLGSSARLTLRLVFQPLKEELQTSTCRFAFQIRNRGEFIVEIVRRREEGMNLCEVRLFDQESPRDDGAKPQKLICASRWKGEFPDSPWIFRHHHGLVTVYCGEKRMLVGYSNKEPDREWLGRRRFPPPDQGFFQKCGISEPLEVAGWSLDQQGAPVTCTQIAGNASASYRITVNPQLLKAFEDQNPQNLSFGVRDINNLRARIHHRVQDSGNADSLDSVQRQFEEWEKGEPNLKDYQDVSLSRAADMFGTNHHYYALAVAGAGMQYFWVGNKDEVAERLLKKATDICEKSLGVWHPDYHLVVSALGNVYIKTGKFQLAEPLLKKTAEATETAFGTESFRYALALSQLAVTQRFSGQHAEAETNLRKSVDLSNNATPLQRAEILIALGELEAIMGELEKSKVALIRAEDSLEKEIQRLNSKSVTEYMPLYIPLYRSKTRRARILFDLGDKEQARQLVRSAFQGLVQFYNRNGGPGRFAGWNQPIINAGPNGFLRGEPAYGTVMTEIADLFVDLDEIAAATGAVRVLDQVPGQSHHERGAIYRLMGKLCAADPNVQIGIRPGGTERMRLDMVWDHQNKAVPRGAPKPDRPTYWQKLALEEFEQSAGREHPDTITLLQQNGLRQWQVFGPVEAEAILRDAFDRSITLLADRVLPGLPEAQAYQFLEANRPPSDVLLSCYQAMEKRNERTAYEVIWQSKALATKQLVERVQLLQAVSGHPELTKMAEDLRETRQQLAQLSLSVMEEGANARRDRLANLTQKKEDIERELARQSEPFRRSRDATKLGIKSMIELLPVKTAVVDFVERWHWTPPTNSSKAWTQKRIYEAFVLNRSQIDPGWSVNWHTLGDADAVDLVLDDWIVSLRTGSSLDNGQSQRLRQTIWSSIEGSLSGSERVILIPDSRLGQIPWGALPGRRPDSYLIEDYALSQTPYGQSIARMLSEPKLEGDRFLVLGGVDYGPNGKWTSLKGTASEAEQLERLRRGPNTLRLSGDAATKSRLLHELPTFKISHLATHGDFLDPSSNGTVRNTISSDAASSRVLFDTSARNPLLLSMLVLAGANRPVQTDERGLPVGSDSYLTAEEVMGMNLARTELVVLSACETGVGKVRGSEGVFSLQRAFLIAGSQSVLASLWKVPDHTTQLLMTRFHENLLNGRNGKTMGKSDSMREAQLWLLTESKVKPELLRRGLEIGEEVKWKAVGPVPPYYWAAFVLSGDWR